MSNKKGRIVKNSKKEEEYEKIISRMERDIEKLKSKNKDLMQALKQTEEHLQLIMKDKAIQEIFQEVVDNTDINVKEKCPKCGTLKMKRVNLGYVKIVVCSCGYRNRVNEPGSA